MGVLRRVALGVLWLLAGLGTLCGVAWGATALGLIKPLVVISGSMEPEIMTGDLIVDTKVPAASLQVGDVVSLPSELTTNLVTHRVVRIVPATDGAYTVTMKGDANAFEDALDYTVSGDVWVPKAQLAGVGTAIIRMTTPAVALPLLAGLVGLIGLVWFIPAPVRERTDAPTPRRSLGASDTAGRTAGAAVGAAAPVTTSSRREAREAALSVPS